MNTQKNHNNKRRGKIIRWIFLSLLFLIVSAGTYVILQADSIITKNLSDFVYEKTDSIYRIEFSALDIELLNRKLTINDIKLNSDTLSKQRNINNGIDFKANSVSIKNINFFTLIRENRFAAEKFIIEKPELHLNSGEHIDLNSFSSNKLNVGDTLKIPIFNEIFFDTVQIINAQLNVDSIFNLDYELPQINLTANHFKIGGRKFTPTPYPFDVSDIALTVDNLTENLPDSIHKISIKQISLSLIHSMVKAFEVKIEPLSDTIGLKQNHYRIEVPEININSNQIEKLHKTDTISIQKMTFINPKISLKFGSNTAKGTPPNEIDFHQLTGSKFKWIKVDHFAINNADVSFIPSATNTVTQHFEQLFINFYDFKVDSNSYRDADRILSSKDMNLILSEFTLIHTDNIHNFTIEDLKIDTRSSKIATGNVTFKPIDEISGQNSTTINITSDGFTCKKVNFLDFYHKQLLPMDELIIKNPYVAIQYKQQKPQRNKKKDNSLILDKTKDYLAGIYIGSAKINDGNIKYNYSTLNKSEGFFEIGYNFELYNLSIDSVTFSKSDKIFFAQDFNVKFNDLNLQLADNTHRLMTKSIDLSSVNKSADIVDLRIIPIIEVDKNDSLNFESNTELYDIRFPKIHLSGANLHRAFFDKKLYISNFNIYNPVFNIEKYGEWNTDNLDKTPYQNAIYSLVSDFLYTINIRSLNMENGTLNLVHRKKDQPNFELSNLFSVKLQNFELNENSSLNKEKLFFSDNIDLILKDHSFTLADGVHKLDAKEIGILSTKKQVYIKDANLYPDILNESFKNLQVSVFADIPEMQISNADIFGLFNMGNLPVGDITFNKPSIKILFQNSKTSKGKQSKKPMLILNDLKSVSANKIKIVNGFLELANYSDFKSKTFATTDVNFELLNFKATSNKGKFTSTYSNFNFNLTYLHFDLPDKIHSLNVNSASYTLSNQNLLLEDISLHPNSSISTSEKKQFITLDIPKLQLADLDLKNYLKNKKIEASDVSIFNPYFKLIDNRIEKKSSFSPYKLDLYPNIKSFAKTINFKNIHLTNGDINLDTDSKLKLSRINITSSNLLIDKAYSQKDKLLNSDNTQIEINKLSGKTKGGYYYYDIDQISINEKGNFRIDKLSLNPVFSAAEFAKRKEYQADYFRITNATLQGQNLNIRELVENNSLLLPTLNVSFEDVKIHRDKTYPLSSNIKTKLPQEALRDLKMNININKAELKVNHFKFTELEKGAVRENMVFVDYAKAEIENITNIKQNLLFNPIMHANIKGILMGAGKVNIDMDMNVKSLGNEFTFQANCGPMDLSKLNPITEPGLKLSIKEGFNNNMDVYFEANEDSAVGNIRFAYNDLKISVLNTRDGEMKEGKFISFLVNSIALKTDNPKPGRILIPAKFENHRDKKRSVVGYCWRSIYAGIKSTMGIKEKED